MRKIEMVIATPIRMYWIIVIKWRVSMPDDSTHSKLWCGNSSPRGATLHCWICIRRCSSPRMRWVYFHTMLFCSQKLIRHTHSHRLHCWIFQHIRWCWGASIHTQCVHLKWALWSCVPSLYQRSLYETSSSLYVPQPWLPYMLQQVIIDLAKSIPFLIVSVEHSVFQ